MTTVDLTATADRDVLVVGPPDITQAVDSTAQAFRDLGQAAREAGEALGITYDSRPSPKSPDGTYCIQSLTITPAMAEVAADIHLHRRLQERRVLDLTFTRTPTPSPKSRRKRAHRTARRRRINRRGYA